MSTEHEWLALSHCPLCQAEVPSNTCPDCGVLWLSLAYEPMESPPDITPTPEVDLALGQDFVLPLLGCPLFMAVLGLSAAGASAWALFHQPGIVDFLAAAVGIPLGGYVGFIMVVWLVQAMLEALIPSRITGTTEQLRLRIWGWRTNLFATPKRGEVCLPREQVRGVCVSKGQGNSWWLNIVHSSGHTLYTGWSGSRKEAEAQARDLQGWIAAEEPPQS